MDAYLGTIMICGFNFAPAGWGFCNGATLQVAQNSALFSLLGVQFGGNGSSTFMLPDLQGRVPVHFGTPSGGSASHVVGEKFGQESMALTQTQLPAHAHALAELQANQTVTATASATVNASDAQANANKPSSSAYWAKGYDAADASVVSCYGTSKNVTMASDAVQVSVAPTFRAANLAIGSTGAGQAFSLAQPSLALNFVICLSGLYPTRD